MREHSLHGMAMLHSPFFVVVCKGGAISRSGLSCPKEASNRETVPWMDARVGWTTGAGMSMSMRFTNGCSAIAGAWRFWGKKKSIDMKGNNKGTQKWEWNVKIWMKYRNCEPSRVGFLNKTGVPNIKVAGSNASLIAILEYK